MNTEIDNHDSLMRLSEVQNLNRVEIIKRKLFHHNRSAFGTGESVSTTSF